MFYFSLIFIKGLFQLKGQKSPLQKIRDEMVEQAYKNLRIT